MTDAEMDAAVSVYLVLNGACGCFHQQLKLFHSELLAQLEQKLELDIKYLTVSQHVD